MHNPQKNARAAKKGNRGIATVLENAREEIRELTAQQLDLYSRQWLELRSHCNREVSALEGYRDWQIMELLNEQLDILLIQAHGHLSLDAIFLITDLQTHCWVCFRQANVNYRKILFVKKLSNSALILLR